MRLFEANGLACDEAALTGESVPVDKATGVDAAGTVLADEASCALMGTVVHGGAGVGVLVSRAGNTEFGRIAVGLGERPPETAFQAGLHHQAALDPDVPSICTPSTMSGPVQPFGVRKMIAGQRHVPAAVTRPEGGGVVRQSESARTSPGSLAASNTTAGQRLWSGPWATAGPA